MNSLEESEKKVMTEEDQLAYGRLVSKADMHVGGVMTIGYAALIIAHLVKGIKKSIDYNYNIFLANEFIMPRVKQTLDDTCFKLALDCFDEMEGIFNMSGKERFLRAIF